MTISFSTESVSTSMSGYWHLGRRNFFATEVLTCTGDLPTRSMRSSSFSVAFMSKLLRDMGQIAQICLASIWPASHVARTHDGRR